MTKAGMAKTYAQQFAEQFAAKGGHARAAKLSSAQRIAIAKKAAKARWAKRAEVKA